MKPTSHPFSTSLIAFLIVLLAGYFMKKMNWGLEGACSLVLRRDNNDLATVAKISLAAAPRDRFCIGICLLKEKWINKLDLKIQMVYR